MKKLIWIALAPVALVVVLLGLVYLLPGYDLLVVRSNSMIPVFSAGDLVVSAAPGTFLAGGIGPGSIVTYNLGGEWVTHRVISINDGTLVTKGDANEEPDSRPVGISQVAGIYLLRIPYLGRATVFLHTKLGWFLLVILPSVLLVGILVKEIVKESFRPDGARGTLPGKAGSAGPDGRWPTESGDAAS